VAATSKSSKPKAAVMGGDFQLCWAAEVNAVPSCTGTCTSKASVCIIVALLAV
jgi:hypothetical protein